MENGLVVRVGGVIPPCPHPFSQQQASGQIYKDDVNIFFSTSDVCLVRFSFCSRENIHLIEDFLDIKMF
jgi:hypothetical protein